EKREQVKVLRRGLARKNINLLGTLGKSKVPTCAGLLFRDLCGSIGPGPRWLLALDDTPTQPYGPCIEGAGLHHNPTPGPAQQEFFYGHIWVTTAWIVRHPQWDTLALPAPRRPVHPRPGPAQDPRRPPPRLRDQAGA